MIPSAWRDGDKGAKPRALTADEQEADAKFQRAIALLKQGKREDADCRVKARVCSGSQELVDSKAVVGDREPRDVLRWQGRLSLAKGTDGERR